MPRNKKTKKWSKSIKTKKDKKVKDTLSQHKKNVGKTFSANKNQLEPGMIVRFKYKGINVHEPHPMVLILNPRWKRHLHGIRLGVLTEGELLKLTKLVKITFWEKVSDLTKLNLPRLKANIGNPQQFYKKKIKPWLGRNVENAYRTYTLTGVSSSRIIDYRFKDMDKNISKDIVDDK